MSDTLINIGTKLTLYITIPTIVLTAAAFIILFFIGKGMGR